MKIATWNVNSMKVRLPHVLEWLAAAEPDVLVLQEIKQQTDAFPAEALAEARDELLADRFDRLRRHVARRDAGPAGGDDDVDAHVIDERAQLGFDARLLVDDDDLVDHVVAGRLGAFLDRRRGRRRIERQLDRTRVVRRRRQGPLAHQFRKPAGF